MVLFPVAVDISADWCGAILASERFYTYPPIDIDLVYLIQRQIKSVATGLRGFYNLDKWVSVATITHMEAEYWLAQDVYWQEAYFQAVEEYVNAQNKKQKEFTDNMLKSVSGEQFSQSPLATIQRPSFQLP